MTVGKMGNQLEVVVLEIRLVGGLDLETILVVVEEGGAGGGAEEEVVSCLQLHYVCMSTCHPWCCRI